MLSRLGDMQWPGDSPVVLHACRYYKIPKRLLEEGLSRGVSMYLHATSFSHIHAFKHGLVSSAV